MRSVIHMEEKKKRINSPEERLVKERQDKLKLWMEKEENPYLTRFIPRHTTGWIAKKCEAVNSGEKTDVKVEIAGRIITLRGHGKTSFADIRDAEGKIQIYGRVNCRGS